MDHLAKIVLNNGGIIKPLIIDSSFTNGTGLFNPSVYVDNNQIYVNIRHCQYTLYHAELDIHEHAYGPLVYINPENDISLTTTNYFCNLDHYLNIRSTNKVNTSKLDIKPMWQFIGLEDGRLVKWNDKFYLSGVRRDTTTHGEGRMELSELSVKIDAVEEISRFRIPAPGKNDTYCEKNWMPIVDMPYHYLKWCNPVEIVKVDPKMKTCETIFLGKQSYFQSDQRGGGQVIPFKDGYLTITHETSLYKSEQGRKNATYRHRFVYWSKDWIPIKISPLFSFMNAKIEFACGLALFNDDIIVTFGFQDNAAYVLKCSKDLIWSVLDA